MLELRDNLLVEGAQVSHSQRAILNDHMAEEGQMVTVAICNGCELSSEELKLVIPWADTIRFFSN